MRALLRLRLGGFSIVELLVVGIILTIIATNATPRLSRGADAIAPATLQGDLAVLRNGIDLYASDHAGAFPTAARFEAQMTQFTDANGQSSLTKDQTHCFGPYLRVVPPLPVGPKAYRGSSALIDATHSTPGAATAAWIYNPRTGEIRANLSEHFTDATGRAYCRY
jgi:type II secretory pathway pseudopilin PulG